MAAGEGADGGVPVDDGHGGAVAGAVLSASIAAGTPVSLRDAVTGLDQYNAARLLTAIRHAAGKRPQNSRCK